MLSSFQTGAAYYSFVRLISIVGKNKTVRLYKYGGFLLSRPLSKVTEGHTCTIESISLVKHNLNLAQHFPTEFKNRNTKILWKYTRRGQHGVLRNKTLQLDIILKEIHIASAIYLPTESKVGTVRKCSAPTRGGCTLQRVCCDSQCPLSPVTHPRDAHR